MVNKTELTVADFALIIGCECQLFWRNLDGSFEYERTGILIGVRPEDERKNGLLFSVLSSNSNPQELAYKYSEAKPVLRPLSDMTEEEEVEVQNHVDKMGLGYNAMQGAEITRYLLSRHFDLFNWIPAGLAIDKTKLRNDA